MAMNVNEVRAAVREYVVGNMEDFLKENDISLFYGHTLVIHKLKYRGTIALIGKSAAWPVYVDRLMCA